MRHWPCWIIVWRRLAITQLQRYAIDLERQRGNYQGAITRMATLDEKLRATPQWQLEVAELLLQAGRPQEAQPYLTVAEEQLQSARMPYSTSYWQPFIACKSRFSTQRFKPAVHRRNRHARKLLLR